jgi:microcystin degradation protein MlrC
MKPGTMKPKTIAAIFVLTLFSCLACTSGEKSTYRIMTAGIAHESNSFIPYLTTVEDFSQRRGIEATEGHQWASLLEEEGMVVIPTLHASAGPSGLVSRETYEAFRDEILGALREAMPVDGIFLDMHGALQVEGYSDAQSDFIHKIRDIAGEEVVIAASFDLHGNISKEFMEGLNIVSAYRTAPHVDGEETRSRTAGLLAEALRNGLSPRTVHINIPILIPGEKGITSVEPLKSLYESLPEIARMEGIMDASIFVGMPWTDVERAGMSVQVVAESDEDLSQAQEQAEALANAIWEQRANLQFDVQVASIDEAIRLALEMDSTVFITDSGDNITAGAAGDGTLVLERLLVHKVQDAVLAGIVDPEAVKLCADAGAGARVSLIVGGKIDNVFSKPLAIEGRILRIIALEEEGQMAAVLQVEGVTLVLLNRHAAFTEPVHFSQVGIDPLAHKIVVVKEGYLFQGLRDIAPNAIMALTPGFANQIMEELDYKEVRRPIYPLDPDMEWSAKQPVSL